MATGATGMRTASRLLLLCGALVPPVSTEERTVASFNVQVFGKTKMSNPYAADKLVHIFRKYDLLCMQEVRDSGDTAFLDLLRRVNSGHSVKYDAHLTLPRGRSNSKEQEAYVWRTDSFRMVHAHPFKEAADEFEREPEGVLFEHIASGTEFVLIGAHITPQDVETELNHMVDVYDQCKTSLGVDAALMLGDFNAGCSYLSDTKRRALDLVTDTRFSWLLPEGTDTTVAASSCPYDRFVATQQFLPFVVPGSAGVFRFDEQMAGVSTLCSSHVSDHYPIELKFKIGSREYTAASFNVQVFGQSKMAKAGVPEVLVAIFRRYDIIVMQEIRDSSDTAFDQLVAQINAGSGPQYDSFITTKHGRSNSKEQEGYVYRKDDWSVSDSFEYSDTGDKFEREPTPVLFKEKVGSSEWFMIGVHISPQDVEAEMQALKPVWDEAVTRFGTDYGLILGDMNAGCSYLSATARDRLTLRTDTNFHWLLGDTVDTTVAASSCPYDRFICSDKFKRYRYVDGSATVLRFDEDPNFTPKVPQGCAEDISDHYPIYVALNFPEPPSVSPSMAPSDSPLPSPTAPPSVAPSPGPTSPPAAAPSATPSVPPVVAPTASPLTAPTASPVVAPTASPFKGPTAAPVVSPSSAPSAQPSGSPERGPSASPSAAPTVAPSASPSAAPIAPTRGPIVSPTVAPSAAPSASPLPPAVNPTAAPSSAAPSLAPTGIPSELPSMPPSTAPAAPSAPPSAAPRAAPSGAPSSPPRPGPPPPSTPPVAAPTQPPRPGPPPPSRSPLAVPTAAPAPPSAAPVAPTDKPQGAPTAAPQVPPTLSPIKRGAPTSSPQVSPTLAPTQRGPPTSPPREPPTAAPAAPTAAPLIPPSAIPSAAPQNAPTAAPVRKGAPTAAPLVPPSGSPILPAAPSASPLAPSAAPTAAPQRAPTGPPVRRGSPTAAPRMVPTAPPLGVAAPTMPPQSAPTSSPLRAGTPTAPPQSAPTSSPLRAGTPTAPPQSAPTSSPLRAGTPTAPPQSAPTSSPLRAGTPTAPPQSAPTSSPLRAGTPTAPPQSAPTSSPLRAGTPTAPPQSAPTSSPLRAGTPTAPPQSAPTSSPLRAGAPTVPPQVPPTAAPGVPSISPSGAPLRSGPAPTTAPSEAPSSPRHPWSTMAFKMQQRWPEVTADTVGWAARLEATLGFAPISCDLSVILVCPLDGAQRKPDPGTPEAAACITPSAGQQRRAASLAISGDSGAFVEVLMSGSEAAQVVSSAETIRASLASAAYGYGPYPQSFNPGRGGLVLRALPFSPAPGQPAGDVARNTTAYHSEDLGAGRWNRAAALRDGVSWIEDMVSAAAPAAGRGAADEEEDLADKLKKSWWWILAILAACALSVLAAVLLVRRRRRRGERVRFGDFVQARDQQIQEMQEAESRRCSPESTMLAPPRSPRALLSSPGATMVSLGHSDGPRSPLLIDAAGSTATPRPPAFLAAGGTFAAPELTDSSATVSLRPPPKRQARAVTPTANQRGGPPHGRSGSPLRGRRGSGQLASPSRRKGPGATAGGGPDAQRGGGERQQNYVMRV
eukprot:TRINITY_DN12914_c0_g2_i1.p1 TRINITY_DN12914_c0_g2~~TRINITY_DN12914_c0_g2_i1.p1  ORF type:complete len:1587 (+),score=326.65 TRINITY_DN12914_c0_g2_i1:106-4761(+)